MDKMEIFYRQREYILIVPIKNIKNKMYINFYFI